MLLYSFTQTTLMYIDGVLLISASFLLSCFFVFCVAELRGDEIALSLVKTVKWMDGWMDASCQSQARLIDTPKKKVCFRWDGLRWQADASSPGERE